MTALVALGALPASAASFSVGPVVLQTTAAHPSALVTIENQASEPLRLQLTSFGWDQRPSGEMQLGDASDLVVYPQLLTIAPHASRRVRAAVTSAAGAREKSYRIVMEELPALANTVESATTMSLNVRTRVSIPLFLAPANATLAAQITNPTVQKRTLDFTIANAGTVHFFTTNITVRGLDSSDTTVFERKLEGWYVLARGQRNYAVTLPKDACATLKEIAIGADAGTQHLSQVIRVPPDACAT